MVLLIARNSFIQLSKLPNVKGRINYIASPARQENLYAVYETTERKFWSELVKCNQGEFRKSGADGQCIEARELIIALPESFTEYYPRRYVLALFTDHFKEQYGVECIAALHHNKRKTNYHIHLIFSERKKLEKPIIKVASRNMFYDERGVHVRTKKEILDEYGEIRPGCSVIKKGEVYEKKLFEAKNSWFKTTAFLDEVKHSYTELINQEVPDEKQKLQVFEHGSLYLPTKKIGKNNPKAEEIAKDNEMRKEWNATVDQALVSGAAEEQIREIKRECISEEIKASINRRGKRPELFLLYLFEAVFKLKELIERVRERVAEAKEERLEFPVRSPLAAKYQQLESIPRKLDDQNEAIFNRELELGRVRNELACATGIFKRKERKGLQEQVDSLEHQVASMKRWLSGIVREHGYETVQEFMQEYQAARKEYKAYMAAVEEWKRRTEAKGFVDMQIREAKKRTEEREEYRGYRSSGRGAR